MRASLAGEQADNFYRTVTYVAWGLGAVFFSFVALPLASSSPYPTSTRSDWAGQQQQVPAEPSTFSLASASSVSVVPVTAASLVNTVRTVSIRRPIGDANAVPFDPPIITASLGDVPANEPPYRPRPTARPVLPRSAVATAPAELPEVSQQNRNAVSMNEVDEYLWQVYLRRPNKRDRSGDFTWKDPAAAARMGKTLQAYVIQGMEPDLREVMYHAGKAMDAAGIQWTIVSAFRDDYRQSIAAGLKARTGYSRHGGSKATGGYGHGRAVDVGHADGENHMAVFRWIDANGAQYGITRPIRHFDPPHVEPRGDWRRIAINLRQQRTGVAAVAQAPDAVDETRPSRASPRVRTRLARSYGRSARVRRYN